MGDNTGISWTDATWNPIRGCSRVSEGCRNCYAERVAARFSGPGLPYEGLAVQRNGSKWTGEVRLIPDHLADPLRWRNPRRIFVNSMSDLFHEKLSNEQIAAVFGVMAAAQQHTFQVLTKRARRMRAWFKWLRNQSDPFPAGALDFLDDTATDALAGHYDCCHLNLMARCRWPLPNVWLGVSVENQAAADERIPDLLATPAAVRFLSCEPLLEAIQFKPFTVGAGTYCFDCGGSGVKIDEDGCCTTCGEDAAWFGVDWVIAGCESGPGARPCDVAWLRSLRDQCAAVGVPFFLKQATPIGEPFIEHGCKRFRINDGAIRVGPGSKVKGGTPPVIELPYLDGVQHAAFPEVRP